MADLEYGDLIGVPFRFGGRGPDAYDCYGLVMEMSERAGSPLPDFGFSSDQALISSMMGVTMPQWQEVKRDPGAVALLRVGHFISHVGFMLDHDRMIHTWDKSGGVTVQRIAEWQQRIVGFYKYVGN